MKCPSSFCATGKFLYFASSSHSNKIQGSGSLLKILVTSLQLHLLDPYNQLPAWHLHLKLNMSTTKFLIFSSQISSLCSTPNVSKWQLNLSQLLRSKVLESSWTPLPLYFYLIQADIVSYWMYVQIHPVSDHVFTTSHYQLWCGLLQ